MMTLLLLAQVTLAETADRIAAIVNDEPITLSEVYAVGAEIIANHEGSNRAAELDVLEELIRRELIKQEIDRLNMDVTQAELDGAMEDVAKSNGLSFEQLKTEVERSGMAWEKYRSEMKENLRQMKFRQLVLQPRIQVDDAVLQDLYRRMQMSQPDEIVLGSIVFRNPPPLRSAEQVSQEQGVSLAQAEQMLAEAQQQQAAAFQQKVTALQKAVSEGTPFAELAARYDEAGMGDQNYVMGTFVQGQLRPDLDALAFSLSQGEYSAPLQTEAGTFVLHAVERRKKTAPPFDKVRAQLVEQLYAQRFEIELEQWFVGARQRAAVDVKINAIPFEQ